MPPTAASPAAPPAPLPVDSLPHQAGARTAALALVSEPRRDAAAVTLVIASGSTGTGTAPGPEPAPTLRMGSVDEARRWLRTTGRSPTRAVVSGPPELATVRAILLDGARGYLFTPDPARPPTPADPGEAGGIGGPAAETAAAEPDQPHLTAREITILQQVADGFTNREIADRIGLSPLTVKSHLARMSNRLQAGDRAHLVLLGLRLGVIR